MAAIALTASQVLYVSGNINQAVAAATITAGQLLYRLADSTVGLYDSNVASPVNVPIGIALAGATAGQPFLFQSSGVITLGAAATLLSGDTIWGFSTAGNMTKTAADVASGCTTSVIGVMLTTTNMQFGIVTGGVV